jgi:TENA/THI-4/PQQC family protein
VKADQLIEKIRIEQKPLAERILHHRYLETVETSGMAPEQFRIFAGQQCHIITSDLRSIALLLARHGDLSSRPYLLGLLQGENAALEELSKFGHALGMSDAEIRAAEPIPGAFAYSTFVAWLSAFGSDAELAGAFVVNLTAWGANCHRMSGALRPAMASSPKPSLFLTCLRILPPPTTSAWPLFRMVSTVALSQRWSSAPLDYCSGTSSCIGTASPTQLASDARKVHSPRPQCVPPPRSEGA